MHASFYLLQRTLAFDQGFYLQILGINYFVIINSITIDHGKLRGNINPWKYLKIVLIDKSLNSTMMIKSLGG